MKNSGKKEKDPVENPDQPSDSDSPDIEEKGKLFHWVDAGVKVVIALVGVLVTIIGYNYQRSFTTSQLLVQQEKGDTEIRAQMFSKITDRLMKPAEQGKGSLVQDVLLAQMLALNFHELIELKPLMIDLDEQLSSEIDRIKKINADEPELEIMKNARGSLRSVARRIRDRQVASLINSPRPEKDAVIPKGAGSIKYISILRKGQKSENRCFFKEKDGKNGCLGEVVVFPGFKAERAMYLSIDSADWKKERFVVSLNCGKAKTEIVLPDGKKKMELKEVEECREALKTEQRGNSQTPMAPGHKSFEVTWFDFPFTDNTLQADGNRYAVFIDQVCKDANAKPDDEPNAVRLGLLYFPKDYYPSRERPVSYKQLNDKLGLSWGETMSK
ncbi:MAG: hypothetical protein V1706_01960 [Pseudomonadota bacterium]